MITHNSVTVKFDFQPTFPLVFFTTTDCILYKSIDDIENGWLDNFGLRFEDVTHIYDREAVPYKAQKSTLSKRGFIFTSNITCYTFLRDTLANKDHKQVFRNQIVDFLSTRKERTADTGALGMEGLQKTDTIEKLLDRVESYALAVV